MAEVRRVPVGAAMVAGLLAGSGALVAGEVAGRTVPGAAPPLLAIGDLVVRHAPPALRDEGIAAFGTADKPALLVAIAVVVALLSIGVGALARRHPRAGEVAVALLGVVALVAQLSRSGTTSLGGLAGAALTIVVGVGLLRGLMGRPLTRAPDTRSEESPLWSRRAFLVRSAVVVAAAAAGGVVAQWLDHRLDVDRIRALRRLRPPVRPAPGNPETAALDVEGISRLITPTREFYRIDTALVVPAIDPKHWSLKVDGMVDRPLELSYDELLAMPQYEADITMQCVSNEVGGTLVGNARWQGVLLRDLLTAAGVRPGADQVVGRSVDRFTAGFPTALALDGRLALVALGMNGEPLPQLHGFPARLVVPGLYGYVSATKWLTSIELTTLQGFDGFWVPQGWAKLGPIKLASRIDVPRHGARVEGGRTVVAGVAWAPHHGIARVQVRVGNGAWQDAELGGELSVDAWRQWRATVDVPRGEQLIAVRATDRGGVVQDEVRRPVRPDGATGYHRVQVTAV